MKWLILAVATSGCGGGANNTAAQPAAHRTVAATVTTSEPVVAIGCGTPEFLSSDASPTAASFAVVFVIDKSLSVGDRGEGARQGIEAAARAMDGDELIGVVAVDNEAHTVALLEPAAHEAYRLELARVQFTGIGSRIELGLARARSMLNEVDARRKHVVLLTDGASTVVAPTTDPLDLTRKMVTDGISLSTFAFGDAKKDLLEQLSVAGQACAYVVNDPSTLHWAVSRDLQNVRRAKQLALDAQRQSD